jgi:RNA polymerase sigma-70 factor (ECF subfamily)
MSRDPLDHPGPLIERVYGYVAYCIGAGPDAEDITMETFERALRYRDSFDASRGDVSGWLIGIARRCIAAAAHNRLFPVDELPELGEDGHEESSLLRIDLRNALETLNERDRELIALRYGADLTARQIAEILDLNTNAVEVALHRVHARVRAELEEPTQPKVQTHATPVRV